MSDEPVAEDVTPLDAEPSERGILFVISSPSGGGKGTLIRRILPRVPRLGYSVSWTTRPPRTGERHGVHYFFVMPEEFIAARERGEFLEWAVVHGHYYGTSRPVVERELACGRDVILEIDVQGAASMRQLPLDSVGVFILPPSYEVLRVRLIARKSESLDDLALRLRNARGEIEHYREFDYVILNDEVERASAQLAAIVYAARAERQRQESLVRRVLTSFPEPTG
ncbi:MAG: guanylate kinase [Acidobacteria bacterium]|nr:MAG: guanylate kinase [Acidobacteriota bacterium]